MTATEAFEALRARRDRERAEQDASHISWRKATLPGSAPSDPPGYVARNGESRAYVRPLRGEYEYGRLVVDDVVPILEIRGTRRLLHDAKTAAFELVRETLDKEEVMAATAEKEKTTTATATTEELRSALVAAVKEAVPEATSEWNKSERYETFKIQGHAFALIFKAGARSVSVKIPAQLRDKTKLSGTNHGFKKSDYGLMRSLSKKTEVATVARVLAAAAKAAKPAEAEGEAS